jgi:GH35 family endo-1,4-beta-xylanase
MDLLGQDVMIQWFERAHNADPHCQLYLNDYGIICNGGDDQAHQDSFYNAIRFLRDYGAPIHGVGIQSHFSLTLTPPTQLLRVLDRFAEFDLPIESTELSLSVTDRALQADYLRDYMTALFSHPAVRGIMLWGFWEGRHWRPDSALYTRDWKLRPHGQAWIDLTQREWRTDTKAVSDESGVVQTRGFLGEYEITVTTDSGERQIFLTDLPATGRELTVLA